MTSWRRPLWLDLNPFYENVDGNTGAGLGASHQTGWTATVAKLVHQLERTDREGVAR